MEQTKTEKEKAVGSLLAEMMVRSNAVYFKVGTWPEVVEDPLPKGLFENGKR